MPKYVCRRVILDSVMDGRSDREGCEEGEEVCDVCQQQVVEESREDDNDDDGGGLGKDREEYDMRQRELQVEDARYQAITLAAEEHQQFQDYRKKLLQQALQGCIFCSLANICGDGAHSGLRCQEASAIDSEVAEAYQLAVKTLTGHSSSIAERLSWTKRRLNNQGDQYDLRSHLAARHGEVEPSTQHQPLLERFLHQREPPEWDVEPVDGEEVEETTEEDDSPLGEDDDDDDLEDAGLNDSRSSVVFIG
ncbi:hypothetical protein FOQG_18876 [Fusarium oxysporum f. sp. raphani 54005]|uniref:Uncharacterized protein n=1 Tax=Fusarium oxysporum f. sp. raphani 54005 TaxID=1089458 RepID=X0C0P8_FUSOX|nr:hypothetical protein FOQG_18876 [Fusarium oxysporum f. sp. raphani 54005]